MSCDLRGIGVLVTRPSGQADNLCQMIAQHGGRAVHFPTITIGPAVDKVLAQEALRDMASYQMAIFISPNAVRYGLEMLDGQGFPTETRICAVGRGSVRALSERGIRVDVSPEGPFDSESLLDQPELAEVSGKRILIIRGNGGRELLANTLRQRGAEVDYAEVYARVPVTANVGQLVSAWNADIQIVTVTSCEILEQLFALLGEEGGALLFNTPLVVISERIRARAQELGCRAIIQADEASDQGLLRAICRWVDER